MRKVVTQIRDIDLIEKELSAQYSGVLGIGGEDETVRQAAKTFIYLDKNLYIFFEDDDELYENINFEGTAKFSIIKNEKIKKNSKIEFTPTYHFISISISGIIKKIEDPKNIDDLRLNYIKKYSQNKIENDDDYASLGKVVMIDTEEIQAVEEIGG